MNIWSFTGALGADCERKATQGGTSVCSFSVAVNSGYGDNKKTTWARCSLFGKKAEGKLPDYLKKGTKVAVCGELTLEEWENKDGKHSSLKVNIHTVDLIGDRPQEQKPTGNSQSFMAQAIEPDKFEDDIPW